MNVLESQWLGEQLQKMPVPAVSPLLNLGSSTEEFRTVQQPHIDTNIFAPCRERGIVVYHADLKAAPGVDLVGDLLDPEFLDRVTTLGARAVLISNLLEHVHDPQPICDAVLAALPADGFVLVSGPKDYPYHADPIDTMFRPTLDEVHDLFPGTELVEGAIINSGNWRTWRTVERGRSLGKTVARILTPFYRPRNWWATARQAPYLFKPITAFAIVLRKS